MMTCLIQVFKNSINSDILNCFTTYDIIDADKKSGTSFLKKIAADNVSGQMKIAPEHTEAGPLSKMMKPGIGSFEKFRQMFEKFSKQAGKKQYLIPYFIAAHPGTTDDDAVPGCMSLLIHVPLGFLWSLCRATVWGLLRSAPPLWPCEW